ncbi:MAG TPA: hypothetical protein DIC36_01000 [Gammaproteobacteria bacterium]|nr:hypothetical protein [Gammaproteobacteria bacterium]
MTTRTTPTQRLHAANQAEREVMKFRDDHYLWHKHLHNVELDAAQVLKCLEMDAHKNTVDFSCRRTGKTAVKELYLLKYLATYPDQELGIVAPKEAQSLVNLTYHLDSIRRSPVLDAWLNFKSGRKQMADTYYQFANRSIAKAYGIFAQVDGPALPAASLEEVDDMPADRLYGRFLLTMGSTRRLGADKGAKNNPQIRVTGVYKGADTLQRLVDSGEYTVLPTIDCFLGEELGLLNAEFMDMMRRQLSPHEYIRQLLCQNVAAKNLIWESKLREALITGNKANLELASPLPGARWKKRGLLSLGYDHSGHGENEHASRSAVVVVEQIGNYTTVIYCRTWHPGTDETVVKRDLLGLWEYFNPDMAMGDAFGIGLLTTINDDLFAKGLTSIDRRALSDMSTQSTWPEWAFAPLRFEGHTKHSMAQALRSLFHNGQFALPYYQDAEPNAKEARELEDYRLLLRQIPNIVPRLNKAAYSSYKMARADLGDDLFDALMAAVWALTIRGAVHVETVVLVRTKTRQELMGAHSRAALPFYG